MKTNKILLTAIIIFFIKSITAQNPTVQNIVNDVRIDSLTKHVKELTGQTQVLINGNPDTIYSRHKNSPGNEKGFQYIKQKFVSYGLPVDSMQFSATGKNIWSVLTGTRYPNKKYVIGAHYDNMPSYSNHVCAPGADDNASGAAAVIEAARIFSQYSFPYTILFALWDEEEQGMIGSAAWAANASLNNDSILAYINLDMIGWDSNNDSMAEIRTRPIAQSVQLADISIQCNPVYNIGLGSIHLMNPGTTTSDHASFWNNNYTAISILEEHQYDINPFYHTIADSLFHFNLSFYEKITKLAFATLGTLAVEDVLTGVKPIEDNLSCEIRLFPNPSFGKFQIQNNNLQPTIYAIEIHNVLGVAIFSSAMPDASMIFDLSYLPKGIYFAKIYNEKKMHTEKIVIQ